MTNKVPIFICTHKRSDNQKTLQVLKELGCTCPIYLVLDDTDPEVQEYINNYPDVNVVVFDKNFYINSIDTGSNFPRYSCAVYARDAIEDIAKSLGIPLFIMADDDISAFRFRYVEDKQIRSKKVVSDIDQIISLCADYVLKSNIACFGFSYSKMYFGGAKKFYEFGNNRVVYNFMFRNTLYPVQWVSWYGEDIITAILQQAQGQYWITIPDIQQDIYGVTSGLVDGGMSEVYRTEDRFHLTMCDFIFLPTATKPYFYKNKFMSAIAPQQAFPKLISTTYRKDI